MVTAARNNPGCPAENKRASLKDSAFFVPTADGTVTLHSTQFDQTYHSVGGAVQEALHVYLHHGLEFYLERREARAQKGPFPEAVHLFEMGFGTGLNAWLTFQYANRKQCPVVYEAVELYPLEEKIWKELHYGPEEAFSALHLAPWETPVTLSPYFTLIKHKADIRSFTATSGPYNVVYYDAFSPDAQPELWSKETFGYLATNLAPDTVLTTYSSKGSVKQALRDNGFEVTRLSGVGGKRHIVRACFPATD